MPRTDLDPRAAVREWVASRANGVSATPDLDRMPLFERRLLTSLHLPELVLLIERLRGEPVDLRTLAAAHLASIDAIVDRFFAPRSGR